MHSFSTNGTSGYHSNQTFYSNGYDPSRNSRKQDDHRENYSSMPVRMRRRWPPPPMVEDEKISLSREHSPTLPGLETDEAQSRGTIDQMPILVEIGKEHEFSQGDAPDKGIRYGKHYKLSSDESSGPNTPLDSEVSDGEKSSNIKTKNVYKRSSARASTTNAGKAPLLPRSSTFGSTTLPMHTAPPPKPRRDASFPRSSNPRETYAASNSQRLYPGTLEELKAHPKETEYLGFAQRHRTMSGSDNAPAHNPANARHMSALGYPGESETPSFSREHPMIYASPVNAYPRSMPPQFQMPRESDHDAIVDSSDSEISPDELGDGKTDRGSSSRAQQQSSRFYGNPPPLPSREQPKQYSRSPSPKRSSGSRTPVLPESSKAHRSELSFPSKRSSTASSPRSPYSSPPASPKPSSRPGSRDGSNKFVYPTINKQPQPQVQHRIKPDSSVHPPVGHGPSNLRHASRPSSPIQPSATSRHSGLSLPPSMEEYKDGSRKSIPETRVGSTSHRPRSSNPSPAPIPRTSRSPIPGLKVDVMHGDVKTRSRTPATLTPETQHRPSTSDGIPSVFSPIPIVPMTTPQWTTTEGRSSFIAPGVAAEAAKQAKLNKARQPLRACPRPGFTTEYNDWWTIPAVPDVDLCPDCKKTLQDSGYSGTFVQSQPHAPGTRTRCDLSVSWMRIAWLLVLAGRENVNILRYLIKVLVHEEPCPGREPAIRPKWYRVYDEDADKHVSDFYMCSECIRSIRVLFPNLKGSFNSHTSNSLQPRHCDLRSSVARFANYIDLLDSSSLQAHIHRSDPDTEKFVRLAKDFAGIRPCPRDNQFRGASWHYMHHIPDFTICEECFMEVVRPAQWAGFEVAEQVSKKPALPYDTQLNLSCQLYSPRMRAIFEECCQNRDIAGLREHSMARVLKERVLQHHVELVRTLPVERQKQEMRPLIEEWIRWE